MARSLLIELNHTPNRWTERFHLVDDVPYWLACRMAREIVAARVKLIEPRNVRVVRKSPFHFVVEKITDRPNWIRRLAEKVKAFTKGPHY